MQEVKKNEPVAEQSASAVETGEAQEQHVKQPLLSLTRCPGRRRV